MTISNITRVYRRFGIVLQTVGLSMAIALSFSGLMPLATAHADDLSSLPVGTVVSQQSLMLPQQLRPLATGQRVVYVTTDLKNNKMLSSGMIITPRSHSAHPQIVAWAHGTTGLADQCAPSTNQTYFYPEAVDAIASFVGQGWVVTATDYQGLGTDGVHQYLVGGTEARSVIDSVRAARNLDNLLSTDWVAAGHSQGGQAVLFSGEQANTYGGGLSLKGVVAYAPASNLDLIAAGILGTPGQGYLVMALSAMSSIDSSIQVNQILAQPALDRLSVLSSGCVYDILAAYQDLTPSQMVVGGQVSQQIASKLAHYGNPAQQPSNAPTLLVQGTADDTVPPDLTAYLQSQMCRLGDTVDLEFIDGVGHDDLPSHTIDLVRQYIQDRFAGLTAPSNC